MSILNIAMLTIPHMPSLGEHIEGWMPGRRLLLASRTHTLKARLEYHHENIGPPKPYHVFIHVYIILHIHIYTPNVHIYIYNAYICIHMEVQPYFHNGTITGPDRTTATHCKQPRKPLGPRFPKVQVALRYIHAPQSSGMVIRSRPNRPATGSLGVWM